MADARGLSGYGLGALVLVASIAACGSDPLVDLEPDRGAADSTADRRAFAVAETHPGADA
jgi:hypothetical protein